MVAIRSQEADRFLETPPTHIFAFLVHGQDSGLIHERAIGLFRKLSRGNEETFSAVRLNGDDLAVDTSRLADEVYSTGLFGGKRVVYVTAGSRNFAPSVEKVFRDPPLDSLLIVEAGSLRRDSVLRSLFEKNRFTASIECYPDSPQDLARLVRTEVASAGMTIADDVTADLIAHLGSDRASTRSELSKLITYAHGNKNIGFRDIEAIVADASTLALDLAIATAFHGQRAIVTETATRAFETGNDAGALLGNSLRHAISLHRSKGAIEAGESFDSAIAAILRGNRSPAARKDFAEQLQLWSPPRLLRVIDLLGEGIRRCRRETKIGQIIAIRAMWSVAHMAKVKDD